jgi:hypothetical protein
MVMRPGDWCVATFGLAGVLLAYSWSLWGSPAFGSLADQAYHLELAQEFERAWRDGDFPPRWAAGANGGRGSVGFAVYPPFFAFLTACWMRLGVPAVEALRLAVLTAAAGAFCSVLYLARAWLSLRRSVLAATAVLLLPGVTLVALARGMYPNFAALAWVALLAGAGQRLLLVRRVRLNSVLVVVAAAGLVLTHTLTAYLLGLAFLGAAPLLLRVHGWRGLVRATVLAAAAAVLTCWHWLPSIAAGGYARVEYLAASHPYLESVFGRTVSASTAGVLDQDWMFLNDLGRYVVLAQSLLGLLLALALGGGRDAETRAIENACLDGRPAPKVLFLRALPWLTGLAFVAATEPGAWLLLQLPRFEMVQFSWRWQLLVALWCGVGLASLPWERKSLLPGGFAVLSLAVFLPLLSASGTRLDEQRADLPDSISPQQFEALPALDRAAYAGNLIELRPNSIDSRFYLPAAFGRAELVSGEGEVTAEELRVSYRDYSVRTEAGALIRLVTYHAPGWSARIDGSEVEIRMECETGLQVVVIPAGARRLELRYRVPWPWDPALRQRAHEPPLSHRPVKDRYCCACPGGT